MEEQYIIKVERFDGTIVFRKVKFAEYDNEFPLLATFAMSNNLWYGVDGVIDKEKVKNVTVLLPDDPDLFIESI